MDRYVEIGYTEGGSLVDGWRYRIHQATRADGVRVYTGLLSNDPGTNTGVNTGPNHTSYVCLAEYSTLGEARVAAYNLLPARIQTRILMAPWCRALWPEQTHTHPHELDGISAAS